MLAATSRNLPLMGVMAFIIFIPLKCNVALADDYPARLPELPAATQVPSYYEQMDRRGSPYDMKPRSIYDQPYGGPIQPYGKNDVRVVVPVTPYGQSIYGNRYNNGAVVPPLEKSRITNKKLGEP